MVLVWQWTADHSRLIEILDRYALRGTFNLNSGLFGKSYTTEYQDKSVTSAKFRGEEIAEVYRNHEVAVHTLTHALLPSCNNEEIVRQIGEDCKNLSAFVGYDVMGMAYPGGGRNFDNRVIEIIRTKIQGIQYARTTISSHNFQLPTDLLRWNPTVFFRERRKMHELARKFLQTDSNEVQLFFIWGHSYELDIDESWEWFEDFCSMISGKDDVYYGTNADIVHAMKRGV